MSPKSCSSLKLLAACKLVLCPPRFINVAFPARDPGVGPQPPRVLLYQTTAEEHVITKVLSSPGIVI